MKQFTKRELTRLRKSFKEKTRWHQARAALDAEERPVADFRRREPVIRRLAPNLDLLVIVSSFGIPPYKPRLVDRLLILASLENLPVLVVLNKVDLSEQRAEAEAAARSYRAMGVDVLVTSTLTGEGVALLGERMEGRSSGLVGHSGVGKSSLLRAVEPSLDSVQVGAVSDWLQRGKHTTTEVRFYSLSCPRGGRVYDLPGLKVVPLEGIARGELHRHFVEFGGFSRACRFEDCQHLEEPVCGVKQAVQDGLLSTARYQSYRDLLEEMQ